MKKQWHVLLILVLALTSCAQKDDTTISKEIDDFLGYHVNLNKFNGTVLVAKKGHVLLHKGYGYRNVESKIANDTSSIFQIYSITKTFTSTMIFKLIEQKQLSLNDKLNKFYPSFPNGDSITIEHLLTHTSGINDNTSGSKAAETEVSRVLSFGMNKPNFSPGKGWGYCNGGYQLLGYIIAKITKMPYEHAVRRYIFEPLQMTNSGFDFKGLSKGEKATAYHVFSNDRKEVAVLYDSTGPFSAGSIYATTSDLYKYYKSFQSQQVISKESQAIAFTASKTNERYGHGWQLNAGMMKSTTISHSGGAVGFRTNFAMIPDDDICIIILNSHENANPEYLTEKIVEILNGKSVILPAEVVLNEGELSKMVGAFSIKEPSMMIYTSILDGRLAVQVAGQGKSVVVAKSDDTFVQDEAQAILKFIKDDNGIYSTVEIDRGQFQQMVATRIESSWGVIGDATVKGWEERTPDIKLSEDQSKKGLWVLNDINLKKGELKFRLNNDWNINFGDNEGDLILEEYGGNIKVEAGVYDIILDLSDEIRPTYGISKKK